MKIIDAHLHYSKVESFFQCVENETLVDYSAEGYLKEAKENEVVASVCMGLVESTAGAFPDPQSPTPMIADLTEKAPPGMHVCLGINPYTLSEKSLDEASALIESAGNVVGVKIYAGYYHFDVNDPIYSPVYKFALEHDLTVAVHSGSTYSKKGLLKYAQPLSIDELAVTYPDLRIMICHMGVPWVYDACEVVAKNENVYIDLSGMLVGSTEIINNMSSQPLLIDRYKQAVIYLSEYDKLLFGTDWPLVPMGAYIDFIKKIIPAERHEQVFYENAIRVYKLKV